MASALPWISSAAMASTARGVPGWVATSRGGAVLLTLIADQNLVPKLTPDGLVDLGKARLEPDLGDVTRPWQVDGEGALYCAGSGGEEDHAVGQGNRLFEVMGDKDD